MVLVARAKDPAIDLALCVSLVSSYHDLAIPEDICFAAEIGLGGEVRAANRIQDRVSEAEKLGFKEIYISSYNRNSTVQTKKIKVRTFNKLDAVIKSLT